MNWSNSTWETTRLRSSRGLRTAINWNISNLESTKSQIFLASRVLIVWRSSKSSKTPWMTVLNSTSCTKRTSSWYTHFKTSKATPEWDQLKTSMTDTTQSSNIDLVVAAEVMTIVMMSRDLIDYDHSYYFLSTFYSSFYSPFHISFFILVNSCAFLCFFFSLYSPRHFFGF